ncbi:MAG: hypothetical protein ACE5HW_00585 [Candidatus Methanofastidiosia archaeon]
MIVTGLMKSFMDRLRSWKMLEPLFWGKVGGL